MIAFENLIKLSRFLSLLRNRNLLAYLSRYYYATRMYNYRLEHELIFKYSIYLLYDFEKM